MDRGKHGYKSLRLFYQFRRLNFAISGFLANTVFILLILEPRGFFGNNENKFSMFAMANESYAPGRARKEALDAAMAMIEHHDKNSISRFLRELVGL